MTGPELAAALRRTADLIETQAKVYGLELEVAPGALLKVATAAAARQRRHRRSNVLSRDGDATMASLTHNEKRDTSVTETVTDAPSPSLPHTPSLPLPAENAEKAAAAAASDVRAESVTRRNGSVTHDARFERVTCPFDLDLLDDQKRSLEIAPGIPLPAQKLLRDEYVTAELADTSKLMTLAQWRKCLSIRMSSRWSNGRKRKELLEQITSSPKSTIDREARQNADAEEALRAAGFPV